MTRLELDFSAMTEENTKLLESYKQALSDHDWYYQYADDYSVYCKGKRTLSAIGQALFKCNQAGLEKEAEEIYSEFQERLPNKKRY